MKTKPLPEPVVAAEIAAEAAEQCCKLHSKSARVNWPYGPIVKLTLLGLALIAWWPVYTRLDAFSAGSPMTLFHLAHGTHLGESVSFFFLDIPKVFMLLLLIVWAIGLVRSFFTPDRTRAILAGKREFIGRRAGGDAGGGDAFLFLFGGAAVHRLHGSRRSPGRHLRLFDLGAHGE